MNIKVNEFEKNIILSGLFGGIRDEAGRATNNVFIANGNEMTMETIQAYIDLINKIIEVKNPKKCNGTKEKKVKG